MALVLAFAVALLATPVAAAVASRAGIVDAPGPHKLQAAPVPYLGGVAVYLGLVAGIVGSRPLLLLPLGLALALGVIDDVRQRSAGFRVAGAVLVGAVAGWVAPFPVPLGAALTAVVTVGLLNAVNLLDGLDGLAAGVALVSVLAFAIIGGDGRVLALALAGGLAAFLVFNRPPARIYLGDGGAYLTGTALALLAALLVDSDESAGTWAAIPLLVAVPVLDTAVAVVRRVRARHPLFTGDRGHVYDQLVDRGRSAGVATLVLVALQAVLALAAVGVTHLDGVWALAVCLAAGAALATAALAGGFTAPSAAKAP